MNDLDLAMGALGLPHRIEHFSGLHDWPPADLAMKAVAWMELQAMKAGKREKSPALIEAEWARDREQARAQAAAHPADALHTWSAMAADYAGLRDVAEAEREAAALAASPACQKELRDRDERDRRDKDLLARAPGILARANPGNGPVTPAQIAAELKIPELKARAASADLEESRSAKRILNTYHGADDVLPAAVVPRKEGVDRAVFMLQSSPNPPSDRGPGWSIASVTPARGSPAARRPWKPCAPRWTRARRSRRPAAEAFDDMRQDEEFRRILARLPARERWMRRWAPTRRSRRCRGRSRSRPYWGPTRRSRGTCPTPAGRLAQAGLPERLQGLAAESRASSESLFMG